MKIIDSVRGELERKEIRLVNESGAKLIIQWDATQVKEKRKDKAWIYTDVPVLKKELRERAAGYPELMEIIADDPIADATDAEGNLDEEKLSADNGTMLAKAQMDDDRHELAFVMTFTSGFFYMACFPDDICMDTTEEA